MSKVVNPIVLKVKRSIKSGRCYVRASSGSAWTSLSSQFVAWNVVSVAEQQTPSGDFQLWDWTLPSDIGGLDMLLSSVKHHYGEAANHLIGDIIKGLLDSLKRK